MSGGPLDAVNHQIRLAARPVGLPKDSDWDLTEEPVADPGDGEVLVKINYLSLDPAMRGWMNEGRSYIAPVQIGDVMRAGAAGEVIASKYSGLNPGDHVTGMLGGQEYATVSGKAVTKVDPNLAPLPVWLNTLGMPGLTAYFGLLDIGQPGAGTDGRGVGRGRCGRLGGRADRQDQGLSRRSGSPEAPRSAATSSRSSASTPASTTSPRTSWPRCVSTAGRDRRLLRQRRRRDPRRGAGAARRHARVVICGAISQYNATGAMRGPSNYMSLLVNHASMTGFVIVDYFDRLAEGAKEMGGWLAAGQLKTFEDIATGGIEKFPTRCCGCSAARTSASWCSRSDPRARRRRLEEAAEEPAARRPGPDQPRRGDTDFLDRPVADLEHPAARRVGGLIYQVPGVAPHVEGPAAARSQTGATHAVQCVVAVGRTRPALRAW